MSGFKTTIRGWKPTKDGKLVPDNKKLPVSTQIAKRKKPRVKVQAVGKQI